MPSPDTGSTASNGSSKINNRGAWISAQARPIFLVMPAEYSTTERVAIGLESESLQKITGTALDLGREHLAEQADVPQQFPTTQPVEEPQPVGQHAHQRLRRGRIGPHS